MDWIIENKEWLFSGILVAIPIAVISWLINKNRNKQVQKGGDNSTNIQVGNEINLKKKDKDDKEDAEIG